jgi:aspartate carbamoyltransferase catalytic subunit
MTTLKGRDVITMLDFTREEMDCVFDLADEMEIILRGRTKTDRLADKVLATAFFQASTRTRLSFESAMQRLGGSVTGFSDPKMTRAGDFYQESVEDTGKMLESYADVVVIRHPREGAPAEMARAIEIPVISGGDGYNEHPTQALLDVYTIRREKGGVDGLHVGLAGDMNIRVMHSLPIALARYHARVSLISPKGMRLPTEWRQRFGDAGLEYEEVQAIEEVLPTLDVLYLIPAEMSSFHVARSEVAEDKRLSPAGFVVNDDTLARARADLIVLHPLPRGNEIPKAFDVSNAARYFKQAYYGVAVRMALLALVLGRG